MIKDNGDGTISVVRPNVWTACAACGQTVTGDSVHTCSPQLKNLEKELERYRTELAQARARINTLEKYIVDSVLKDQK